ncbi:hypothetical protein ACWEQC_21810 [Streptomyces shenzhenensis]
MSTVISVLIWLAEAVDDMASLGWWFVPVFVPGAAVGVWLWLRPTGKHRLPHPGQSAAPVQAEPSPALTRADVEDDDTIVFQAVAYRDGAADS